MKKLFLILSILPTIFIITACTRPQAPQTYSLLNPPITSSSQTLTAQYPALTINRPQASSAINRLDMQYITGHTNALNHFSDAIWAAPPTQLLQPLLFNYLTQSKAFKAVVSAPSDITTPLRLDTQILTFHQHMQQNKSEVVVMLNLQLIDTTANKILATTTLQKIEPANANTAIAGAAAYQRIFDQLLPQVEDFIRQALNATR